MIDRNEFEKGFPEENPTATMKKVFHYADINNDRVLEFNEFAVICFNCGSLKKEQLKTYVQEVVCDCTDEVSLCELKKYFECSVDPDELENFVSVRINTSGEGKISSCHILNFLQNDTTWITVPFELPQPS